MKIGSDKKFVIAFTLVELLVVIAIIGILSGLIIVGMNSSVNSARVAKGQIFASSLRDSMLTSLVSEWKFDDGSGSQTSTADSWSGNNNGTLVSFNFNTTDGWRSGSSCVSGGCLQFDGVDDYVNCGHGPTTQITGVITVGTWFKTGYNGWNTVLAKDNYNNNGWWFGSSNGGNLYFYMFSGTVLRAQPSNSIISDNNWHYIVAVYDGYKTIYYLDGVNVYTKDWGSYLSLGNDVNYDLGIGICTGYVDEPRIYNAAMPTSYIEEQYYSGINKLLAKKLINREDYNSNLTSLMLGVEKKDKTVYTLNR